jgi:hypothetical protein
MASRPGTLDAASIAAAAQEWRLPVCDYRAPTELPPWRDAAAGTGAPSSEESDSVVARSSPRPALLGVRVLDLTSMWAGPLTTWLLARLGADVVKIEPTVRPDGFRARHGRGVWPGGRAIRDDGSESGVFNALNSGKRSWAVDAHEDPDWLPALCRSADLVVDSFSPRVMGQLGLDRDRCDQRGLSDGVPGDGCRRLSMPAFPPGPLRQWVAYGTGVHALSGLGHQPDRHGGPYRPPGVTYPDPLAGLQGTVAALETLSAEPPGTRSVDREVSLAASLEPLLDGPRRLLPSRSGTGPALLRAGVAGGALAPVQDGAGWHWYPVGPFRFPHSGELRPAPGGAEQPPEGALPWTR